jgi:hypothetical protein
MIEAIFSSKLTSNATS